MVEKRSMTEAVRRRPAMYFGTADSVGVNNAIYEIIQNSVDQFVAGLASTIRVNIEKRLLIVSDDGPGLPFDQRDPEDAGLSLVERYMTSWYKLPVADNLEPSIKMLGSCGIGLAIVNAASSSIFIESSDGHHRWEQKFGRGEIISKAFRVASEQPSGIKFKITLDPEIFGDHSVDKFELRKTMFELAHFFPGLTVEMGGERFFSENGLLDMAYLLHKTPSTFPKPLKKFCFEGENDQDRIGVALVGDSPSGTECRSWVNGSETVEGGTHVEGLCKALLAVGWQPSIALIHVMMREPIFGGATKDKLVNRELTGVIEGKLTESLRAFVKNSQS